MPQSEPMRENEQRTRRGVRLDQVPEQRGLGIVRDEEGDDPAVAEPFRSGRPEPRLAGERKGRSTVASEDANVQPVVPEAERLGRALVPETDDADRDPRKEAPVGVGVAKDFRLATRRSLP